MSDKPNPPKGIKKILNFIGVALTVLLIVMLIYTIVMLVMGRPVFIFGYSVVRIQTESMYVEGDPDSIAPGDFLIIKKTDPEDLKIGDIITFYSDNPQIKDKLNTHRIVEIIAKADGSLEFVTKGDGYLVRDAETARAARVSGVYVGKSNAAKSVFRLFSNKMFFILLIFIPAVVMMFFSTRDLISGLKQKDKTAGEKAKTFEELVALEVERLKKEGIGERSPQDGNHTEENSSEN